MSNYDKQIETAQKLISAKGAVLSIRRATNSTGKPVGGEIVNTYTNHSVNGVRLPATNGKLQAFGIRADSDLVAHEVEFCLADKGIGETFEVRPNDEIQIGGVWKQVLGCTPLKPNGQLILNKFSFRQ